MKIYAIAEGEYDDYQEGPHFTTEELANAYLVRETEAGVEFRMPDVVEIELFDALPEVQTLYSYSILLPGDGPEIRRADSSRDVTGQSHEPQAWARTTPARAFGGKHDHPRQIHASAHFYPSPEEAQAAAQVRFDAELAREKS